MAVHKLVCAVYTVRDACVLLRQSTAVAKKSRNTLLINTVKFSRNYLVPYPASDSGEMDRGPVDPPGREPVDPASVVLELPEACCFLLPSLLEPMTRASSRVGLAEVEGPKPKKRLK